jgi:subtilisin family serine protease
MLKRVFLPLFLLLAFAASSAAAITIDPELVTTMSSKADGEVIRVMLLMDDHADLAPVEATLTNATWQERRQAIITTLKAHAAKSQGQALAVLENAKSAGQVERIRSLWLANSIAFEGTQEAILAVADVEAAGTMFLDKPYDMVSNVMGPKREIADDPDQTQPEGGPGKAIVWNVSWINADDVWNLLGYTGTGVLVAHFDTGIWLTHPDIANRLWVNPGEIPGNYIDDDNNGYVDDVHGYDFANDDSDPNDDVTGSASNHGTHTAGTVCGDGTNGTETGVAPGASIQANKTFQSDGSGAYITDGHEAQQYAMEMGARIFTMSLGLSGDIPPSYMRTEREIADAQRAAGIIFFNSAGNDHYAEDPPLEIGMTARVPCPWMSDPSVPYSSKGGVMAVGGTGYRNNNVYVLSSWGPVTWEDVSPWYDWPLPTGLIKPDIAAPGQNVNSLQKPSGYTGDSWSGTSMACPHLAGVAALMLEKNPSLSPEMIDEIIETTALDLGTAGKDNTFGAGLVDAYAAVNAVPTTLTPHLVWTDLQMDPSGDNVFDPGETIDVIIELTNNSPVVDATGVTATLTVNANPYVTVADGSANYGTIAMGGGTANNFFDTFQLTSLGGTPQGYEFTLTLTVNAQNGYQKDFDIGKFVGLPDYLTHDVGNVFLTVTDQGSIGFMDDNGTEGEGFGLMATGTNFLFVGSLWGGTGQAYICNRDYSGTGAGAETFEWEVSVTPNGRCRDQGAGKSDQDYTAMFTDSGHASPKPIVVDQYSYAWSDTTYDDFVIITYVARNTGVTTVSDYHLGIFVDWDINTYDTNEGDTDASRHLTYLYSTASNYCGIALLYPHTHKNLTFIHNETYVYPTSSIDDGIKSRHLKGIMSLATTTGPADWSAMTSAGGFTLAPGDSVQCTFALVYGHSLAELQDNTDAAQTIYYTTPVEELVPIKPFGLSQNQPNPFNPSTTIKFSVEQAGHVSLAVYDLSGRLVRTLVDQNYGTGEHAIVWDGRNDAGMQMPSGLYVYKYMSGKQFETRKMMLVK